MAVIQLSAQSPAGRELAGRWGLRFTPTFVLFNAAGQEVWRSLAVPDPADIASMVGGGE